MDEVKVKIINRGRGRVAMHQGYQYYRHCVYKNGNSLWKCNQYKNTKCVGSITLSTATEERFASLCYAGRMAGYTMGFNGNGLVFSINTLSPHQLNPSSR